MKTKLTKTIMSSLAFACALVCLVAAMALGTSGTARADSTATTCSVHTLRGLYMFNAHGSNIVGGVAVPKALMEGITFNGDGTVVSQFATVSINGMILHPPPGGTGTYTVNADCTGTLSWNIGHSWDLFVDPSGKQLWRIQTHDASGAGPVFEGIATRVSW
jgi:hypothetical protein